MTTTFAEMTQDERTQCKGLWCSYETPTGKRTAIIHDFPLGNIREKKNSALRSNTGVCQIQEYPYHPA